MLPLGIAALVPVQLVPLVVPAAALASLGGMGALAASIGGASAVRGALRVGLWGALAMALTYGVGALFGTLV